MTSNDYSLKFILKLACALQVFLLGPLLWAMDFPDLVIPKKGIPKSEPVKELLKAPEKTSPPSPKEGLSSLEDVAWMFKKNLGIGDEQRVRILSLIQEMQGFYDHAYLTLRSQKGVQGEPWYKIRELYLSEKLGLEEDTERLGSELQQRYFKESLAITKLEFCKSVQNFGSYTPLLDRDYTSGKKIMIYVEVKGIVQNKSPEGQYLSSFQGRFVVKNESDVVVYRENTLNTFKDVAYSEKRDYFFWIIWRANLPRGSYELSFTVEDDANLEKSTLEKKFILR